MDQFVRGDALTVDMLQRIEWLRTHAFKLEQRIAALETAARPESAAPPRDVVDVAAEPKRVMGWYAVWFRSEARPTLLFWDGTWRYAPGSRPAFTDGKNININMISHIADNSWHTL